jgi:hypothetical protein
MALSRKNGSAAPRLWNGRPFRILSLDPGKTSGWAYCEYRDSGLPPQGIELDEFHFECGHLGPEDHHLTLWNVLLNRYGPVFEERPPPLLEVVCESFEFRQHINRDHSKTKVELISKEYIGIVNLFCQVHNLTPHFQTASAAKSLVPDKGPMANVKLKQLGVYQPVTHWVHAMDAMRHLLRYMVVDKRIREPITDKWLKDV